MDKSEKDPAQAAEEARNGKPLTDQDLETAAGAGVGIPKPKDWWKTDPA